MECECFRQTSEFLNSDSVRRYKHRLTEKLVNISMSQGPDCAPVHTPIKTLVK